MVVAAAAVVAVVVVRGVVAGVLLAGVYELVVAAHGAVLAGRQATMRSQNSKNIWKPRMVEAKIRYNTIRQDTAEAEAAAAAATIGNTTTVNTFLPSSLPPAADVFPPACCAPSPALACGTGIYRLTRLQ